MTTPSVVALSAGVDGCDDMVTATLDSTGEAPVRLELTVPEGRRRSTRCCRSRAASPSLFFRWSPTSRGRIAVDPRDGWMPLILALRDAKPADVPDRTAAELITALLASLSSSSVAACAADP